MKCQYVKVSSTAIANIIKVINAVESMDRHEARHELLCRTMNVVNEGYSSSAVLTLTRLAIQDKLIDDHLCYTHNLAFALTNGILDKFMDRWLDGLRELSCERRWATTLLALHDITHTGYESKSSICAEYKQDTINVNGYNSKAVTVVYPDSLTVCFYSLV